MSARRLIEHICAKSLDVSCFDGNLLLFSCVPVCQSPDLPSCSPPRPSVVLNRPLCVCGPPVNLARGRLTLHLHLKSVIDYIYSSKLCTLHVIPKLPTILTETRRALKDIYQT